MKKTAWLLAVLMVTGLFLMQGTGVVTIKNQFTGGDISFPADVRKVIDQKCYGCHSVKGRSDDAKEALMWDSIPKLKTAKQVSVLNDIIDVLDDGSMPPEDVVKKYPEARLLDEERAILHTWAEATADSLLQ